MVDKCINGSKPPCSKACPMALDIRAFMDKAQRGKWNAAHRILRNTMVFPEIACRVCPAPCEAACMLGSGVAVKDLVDACNRLATKTEPDTYNLPKKNKSVAVIGSGMSGMAFALRMAVKKYEVNVYDHRPQLGGALLRLPVGEQLVEKALYRFSKEDVGFHTGVSFDELAALQYDAAYIDAAYTDATHTDDDIADIHTESSGVYKASNTLIWHDTHGDLVEAMRRGAEAAQIVEAYFTTGNMKYTPAEETAEMDIPSPAFDPGAGVLPESGGYTGDEAVHEASRCQKCDCNLCLEACEMLGHYGKKPRLMAKEIKVDNEVFELASRTMTREISSCTGCGKCTEVCPVNIDMGAMCMEARSARVSKGSYPYSFHDYWLGEMNFHLSNEVRIGPAESKYLFFPGCQLGSSNNEYVTKAYEFLCSLYEGVSMLISCCGIPAKWAGQQGEFESIIAKQRSVWLECGQPDIVTACATCASVWREHIPEANIIPLYELLTAQHGAGPSKAAIFHPCSAEHDQRMQASVRALAESASVEVYDAEKTGITCCGWGGHINPANPDIYHSIADKHTATDEPYIVYCANCRDVFSAHGKRAAHILDVVFGLDDGSRGAVGINQKRNNAIRLRKHYGANMTNDENSMNIPDDIMAKMDEKMILRGDITETITVAEATSKYILDSENGHRLCSYQRKHITYWAEYSVGADGITVRDVYSHRMRILN